MDIRYILEMVTLNEYQNYQNWRWKQIAIGNNLDALKRLCGNRHRIIDASTLKEIYRTAPEGHYQLMAIANQ